VDPYPVVAPVVVVVPIAPEVVTAPLVVPRGSDDGFELFCAFWVAFSREELLESGVITWGAVLLVKVWRLAAGVVFDGSAEGVLSKSEMLSVMPRVLLVSQGLDAIFGEEREGCEGLGLHGDLNRYQTRSS